MHGEVLHYADGGAETGAAGVIAGEDGQRYAFGPGDLKVLQAMRPGLVVDFVPGGDRATDIFVLTQQTAHGTYGDFLQGAERARSWLAGGGAAARGALAPRDEEGAAGPRLGGAGSASASGTPAPTGSPVALVRHALRRYADRSGWAGRREFAVFVLFALLAPIAAFLLDLAWNNVVFGPERLSYGYIFPLLTIVTVLGLVAPLLAVASRRLHDLCLTGWLVLLLVVLMFLQPLGLIALVALAVVPSVRKGGAAVEVHRTAQGATGPASASAPAPVRPAPEASR